MATPEEFDPNETLDLPIPVAVEESDIAEVPFAFTGTDMHMQKVQPESGVLYGPAIEGIVQQGKSAPQGGIKKGQQLYYGNGRHTSPIERIDHMADGSYWVKTRTSHYRIEVSNTGGDDTISQFPPVEADAETGGNPAGDGRLKTRGELDNLTGEQGDQ